MYIRLRTLTDEPEARRSSTLELPDRLSTIIESLSADDQSLEELLLDEELDIISKTFELPDAEPEVYRYHDS
jgi:hypothetical protein